MTLSSCRDCENFEDRREIEGVAICANNVGPYVCCAEFQSKDGNLNENRLYNRFCLGCTNLIEIDDIPICAKNHTPRIVCDAFIDRFERLNLIRQSNQMQTVLAAYAIKHFGLKPLSEWMVEVGQNINWRE